jgi:hypothetical protein
MDVMLVDSLEKIAEEIAELQERLKQLDKEYKKEFDRDIKEEMNRIRKEIKRKKYELNECVYNNLEEFRLLKKHFPDLFNIFIEDEIIGSTLKKKEWLIEFKELKKKECEKKFGEIKAKQAQLKEAKAFLKGWVGPIDARSLGATWNVLKDVLADKMEKDEALAAIEDASKKLKKEGWLVMLNEPLILQPLRRFFKMLKKASEEEYEKKAALEKAKGRGTISEYKATKELRDAQKKRKKIERMCRHLLLANSKFLHKMKNRKITWGDSATEELLRNVLNKIEIKNIDEKKWIKEMKKRLEI